MEFEFDPKKSATNLRKHGVSLADSELVFYDEQALTREDTDSSGEARFVTVDTDALGRILTVCRTERGQNIRLISARPSTQAERKMYES
jgi:uncharacterized DUF497 family protein